MKALLDVNVLIALADTNHTHHPIVKSWYQSFIKDKANIWCSCAITELAVFRILSQPTYTNRTALEDLENWLNRVKKATLHQFLPSSVSLTDSLINWQHLQGHRQLTDAYLLALAVQNQAVLVSFDSRINYRIIKTAKANDLITLG